MESRQRFMRRKPGWSKERLYYGKTCYRLHRCALCEKEVFIMSEVSVSVKMDAGLRNSCQDLFSGLGMDLGTAITVFLRQSLRAHGFPFPVSEKEPNDDTIAAMEEYYEMKAHPEKYKRYPSFRVISYD